ncbi:unnamed protein product, partial [Nesidiocoris tenuis]
MSGYRTPPLFDTLFSIFTYQEKNPQKTISFAEFLKSNPNFNSSSNEREKLKNDYIAGKLTKVFPGT